MPFLMRWQAEAFTNDTLERDEIAKLLKQLGGLLGMLLLYRRLAPRLERH